MTNKLPSKIGRISLCHSLTSKGGVHSEFTITRESEDSFYIVSADIISLTLKVSCQLRPCPES